MRRLVLLLASGLWTVLLVSLLTGCGEQNLTSKRYDMLKDEIKTELKAELLAEMGTMQASAPAQSAATAPPPPAPAAAEEEEDDEDKFGC